MHSRRDTLSDFINGPLKGDAEELQVARDVLSGMRSSSGGEVDKSGSEAARRRDFLIKDRPALFDYQMEVVSSCERHFRSGQNEVMISIPTGGGKTRTALWLYRRLLNKFGQFRMLWVAPSRELVDQAVVSLEELWGTYRPCPSIQVVTNDIGRIPRSKEADGVIVFCTTQLASRRLPQIRSFNPSLLVFDEAHHATARTCRKIISTVCQSENAYVVGLSATPGRSDPEESDDLSGIFSGRLIAPRLLGNDPVRSLQQRGVLSQVELRQIELPRAWDAVRVRGGIERSLSLSELACNSARFWAAIDTICLVAKSRRCLVFGASIAHCQAITAVLVARGYRAHVLSHMLEQSKRDSIIAQFRAGSVDVIVNTNILSAGFDLPELEDVVLATPIRSPIYWEQIMGRVSRGPLVGGGRNARVWELDDHASLHQRVLGSQRFAGDHWE